MKKIISIVTAALISTIIKAQAPSIAWEKTFGGSGADNGYTIQKTIDGGYILGGSSNSTDGDVTGLHYHSWGWSDAWVVKLDASGNLEWQKALGGTGSESARHILQTSDGGYIVAGNSFSTDGDVMNNHGSTDIWVVKLDTNGNILWEKSIGGSNIEHATSIIETTDGGYTVAGYSYSSDGDATINKGVQDIWVIKLNASGDIVWERSYGGSDYDIALDIKQTNDGGYIVTGTTESNDGDIINNHGGRDLLILKLNSTGAITWQKLIGGSADDQASSIIEANDGGFIVAGYTESNDGDVSSTKGQFDCWVVKVDTQGNILWQKTYGGSVNDYASSIIPINSGYIVAGSTASNDGDITNYRGGLSDQWILEIDNLGNLIWQKNFGGTRSDFAYDIIQTANNEYTVIGSTFSDDLDVSSNQGLYDYWIVKLSFGVGLSNSLGTPEIGVYPNPSEGIFQFRGLKSGDYIEVFDFTGRSIFTTTSHSEMTPIDISNEGNGVYFYRVVNDKNTVSGKIIKTH